MSRNWLKSGLAQAAVRTPVGSSPYTTQAAGEKPLRPVQEMPIISSFLKGLNTVNQYIVRRPSTWATTKEIEGGIAASARVASREMFGQVRWIRCYVVNEPDGRLGMFDVYEAHSAEMIREHARRAGLPSDIYPVETTFIVRADLDELASAA